MTFHCQWLLAVLVPITGVSIKGGGIGNDDWPAFRGPDRSGVSADKDLPTKWSDTDNLAWKVKLPGPGGSSPVILGDRVFLTCYTGYGADRNDPGESKDLKRHLLCIDRKKGEIRWDREVAAKLPEPQYKGFLALHGYASSTPATDGQRVYVFFGKSGLFAFSLEGKQLWRADVGTGTHGWGSATSPLLYKGLVIVNASVESGSLLAFNRESGKPVWKCPGTGGSWNSPVLVDVKGGGQELVVRAPRSILGIDPATGNKLWHYDGFRDGYVCPTVVARDGIVYSLGGRFEGLTVAVRAGGRGDVTQSHKVWSRQIGRPVPSPALAGDYLFWVSDNGIANCVKASNGEKVYAERLKNAGTLYASITIADGKVYAVSRQKGTFVLPARPKFEVLAHNTFASDTSVANGSPAVSQGQVFLRSEQYLYCVQKK
jgi:outer membrane protein assembly factor BamB